jgi:hypothetical protein
MTLDKMIKALQPVWEDLGSNKVSIDTACWNLPHISKEAREQIIVALKAGQAMRKAVSQSGAILRQIGWYNTANDMENAARAWDEAMREEV